MKRLLMMACTGLALTFSAQAQNTGDQAEESIFQEPFALKANGEFIDVTTGHSAPLIYDFNKDGVDDLLVGEFGEVDYDGIDEGKSHEYVQGRCRVYINHGTDEQPLYKDFFYLSAGGVPMAVPVTCCISFVPRIVDMDGDGIDDVISGSYTSEIFFWKGKGNQEFEAGKHFTDPSGKWLVLPNEISSMCVDPVDWDNDGDYDLFASTRGSGFYLFENTGNAKEFRFAPAFEVKMKDDPWWLNYYRPFDWDGDGLFDLVGGKEFGDLIWSKNIGKPGKPEFAPLTLLRKNEERKDYTPDVRPIGSRPKLWVCDYNRDGKNDILVGDVYSTEEEMWKLTPKEEKKKAQIQMAIDRLPKDYFAKHPEVDKLIMEGHYDEIEFKHFKKYQQKEKDLWGELEKMRKNIKSETHGYVWVFLRK